MPALFPIILTATQIVLAADSVPKFDVERACRAAGGAGLPGRDSAECQRDEQDARSKVEKDWSQYSAALRSQCDDLVTTGGAPSYVELLTCLEMAKQVKELPEDSKMGIPLAPLIGAPGHPSLGSAVARSEGQLLSHPQAVPAERGNPERHVPMAAG